MPLRFQSEDVLGPFVRVSVIGAIAVYSARLAHADKFGDHSGTVSAIATTAAVFCFIILLLMLLGISLQSLMKPKIGIPVLIVAALAWLRDPDPGKWVGYAHKAWCFLTAVAIDLFR
ncbi:MAG: hypothetical protein AAFX06_00730 [Planctomycetota bacterium]